MPAASDPLVLDQPWTQKTEKALIEGLFFELYVQVARLFTEHILTVFFTALHLTIVTANVDQVRYKLAVGHPGDGPVFRGVGPAAV